MSMMPGSRLLPVVIEAMVPCGTMANSFPFLTGLCEKEQADAGSFKLLSGTHK
jgi:hypothetical protein